MMASERYNLLVSSIAAQGDKLLLIKNINL
jgi:hypothetical protein